ncbi:MAG: bifunctional 5,10-methylenetetrahydrofolate dehydrogenase/5,10-methenyltetrahydrofolate cyclohydrolase [Acetivibrionales bacterium]|jgi:methylenetetrahydrofolate dehydrogenase (NADP+)/methenyltetrahydrofolate cyclohydrolase
MAFVMKGIDVVNSMKERMLGDVERLKKEGIVPCLAIIRLGAKPDDLAYERGAVKRCEGLGIKCVVNEYPENTGQEDLIREIQKINADKSVHGILLFRPLPKHLDINVIKHIISPEKDIDCLNPVNVAKVFEGDETGFAPCTPAAVVEMLDYFKIDVTGKRVVIIGRSLVVGKPLSMLLLKKNATVTVCHTKTRDIEKICKSAEILIAAAGAARMVTAEHVSPGQVVVDVGINVDENGNLCGDVDFDAVEKIVDFITPVPKGVGTVTSSVLAKHVIKAACLARA